MKNYLEKINRTYKSPALSSTRGITLIALVITIVVLIILAGVAINLTLGENGIFKRAKEAKRKMEIATIKEQIQMDILEEQLANNGEISSDRLREILEKYGEVQTDEEGKIIGIKTKDSKYYISLKDILNNEQINPSTPEGPDEVKITSIVLNKTTLELEEGNQETLTITIQPENAKNKEVEWTSDNTDVATVGTNGEVTAIAEGTAIVTVSAKSDNTIKTQCTVAVKKSKGTPGTSGYAGGAYNDPYIPTGFKYTGEGTWNSGYTIIGETSSIENEFVWVPCVLTESEQQAAQNKGDTVQIFQKKLDYPKNGSLTVTGDTTEAEYIRTSVGTYEGFYIAKYEAGIPGTTESVETEHNTPTTGSILPVSKPNVGVWNCIFREDALSLSNKMIDYEVTGVRSTLISGAAWDTTMQWITATIDSSYATNSTNKGNYSGSISVTSSNLNTAYAKNNIYDIAGNVYEWTTENCIYNNLDFLVSRGGSYRSDGADIPGAYRDYNITNAPRDVGFRTVIYK